MNLDQFLSKTYDIQSYNCLHFASDIWREITGEDLRERLGGNVYESRSINKSFRRDWKQIAVPSDLCLAVFSRSRKDPKVEPYQPSHVGVWFKGLVGHLTEAGACWQEIDLARRGYNKVTFYQ
jgi:hypothetical protein